MPNEIHGVNIAKTEFREAYNTGDVERLMAVLDEGYIDFSDGHRSGFGEGAKANLRAHLRELFARYKTKLVPIIIEVKLDHDIAVEYGLHEVTLTPKAGGDTVHTRTRYIDIWKNQPDGSWKLAMFMDNADVPDQ